MAEARFYILPSSQAPDPGRAPEPLYWACMLAQHLYLQNERVFVLAEDQAQAEALDELLFAFEADSFVPHNLVGEGPQGGAPVEIGWQAPKTRRSVLINLCDQAPSFALQSRLIVDLVPNDEELKVQARERFKQYRAQGHALTTHDLNSQPLS